MQHVSGPSSTGDFLGSGWSFPVRINSRGGIGLVHAESDVEESIRLILATPIGERRMRPEFGCGVHDLVFAINDATTHGLIQHYVIEALTLWEPRIEVLDVGVSTDEAEPSQVMVHIHYALRATNQRRNLVYPFYLIPGEP